MDDSMIYDEESVNKKMSKVNMKSINQRNKKSLLK
jgi:hypothetical protein